MSFECKQNYPARITTKTDAQKKAHVFQISFWNGEAFQIVGTSKNTAVCGATFTPNFISWRGEMKSTKWQFEITTPNLEKVDGLSNVYARFAWYHAPPIERIGTTIFVLFLC